MRTRRLKLMMEQSGGQMAGGSKGRRESKNIVEQTEFHNNGSKGEERQSSNGVGEELRFRRIQKGREWT
jgi:hypothetical protein